MTQDIKTAIKQAEKTLEQERSEQLQTEIYTFLKGELEEIDGIENRIRKLSEQKRIHEENVKNVKQGNLAAVEKRRESLNASWPTWTYTTSGTGIVRPYFYAATLAGTTITTTAGKTYVF